MRTTPDDDSHEPHIRRSSRASRPIEELAALVAVLGTAGGAPAPGPQELNLWGQPVDKLRYRVYSWQRVTLLELTHMRR